MALSGKDVDVTKVRSCKKIPQVQSCNKVVDMPVEVQRRWCPATEAVRTTMAA